MIITKKTGKPTIGKFLVKVNASGVFFCIDHQGFQLFVDDEDTKKETKARRQWYAKQLRIALKRLQTSGSNKKNGRQSRTNKKA